MIKAHGGKLVNRVAENSKVDSTLASIELNRRELCDLELIAIGAFSPLEGFIGKKDFVSILEKRRLASGVAWTLPITLSVAKERADKLKEKANLTYEGKIVGTIEISEKFEYLKEEEAERVYKTKDLSHPGVKATLERGDVLIGGKITLLKRTATAEFSKYSLDSAQTRAEIERRGWEKVVAFQTRNPIHRAHEYLIKTALEVSDGVLIHPLVGETKSDDIPANVRLKAYEVLIEKYFPKDRVLLATLPASMRYAGPREAIHHAIMRQNYGATHFIVGRDHAGVGNFYGPFDAQKIFTEFTTDELAIKPIFFDNSFYCTTCKAMATEKTCPHPKESRLSLSGTQVRKLLAEGKALPEEFTRPEVADVLREAYLAEAK